MTYEHQMKLEKRKVELKNLRKLRGQIYNDSSTFNEYQMSCVVNGIHRKRIFDRLWYFYLRKNYGSICNIVVSLAACALMTLVVAIVVNAIGIGFTPIGWFAVIMLIDVPFSLVSCFLFNAINRNTYRDYLCY